MKLTRIFVALFLCASATISCSTQDRELQTEADQSREIQVRSSGNETPAVFLLPSENERMRKLNEKCVSIMSDMARIIGKKLGKNLLPFREFEISADPSGSSAAKVTPLDDEITIGYYCDPPGVCQPDPCGSASSAAKHLTAGELEKMRALKSSLFTVINDIGRLMGHTLKRDLLPFSKFRISQQSGRTTSVVIPLDDEITIGYYCDPPGVCQSEPCN